MTLIDEICLVEKTADRLFSEKEVETALEKMAESINLLLFDRNPLFLTVMNGGVVTAGKLLTRLKFPLTIDAVNASRYRNQISGREINWILKPTTPMRNRTILIVDDILDEGLTLNAIYQYCQEQGAASIYSAVLVDKILDHEKPIKADFIGLQVENRYLFGYGLDYKGYLRNAPGIYACKD
jgi:hypoxanthine phosphoribosyltransferase